MWPHGRRLCRCTMYKPGATPMCSCNWPAGGNDAGTSAPYPRPVTTSNRNSSTSIVSTTSTDKCNMTSQWYQPMVPNLNFVTDTAPSNSREMRNRAEKLRRDKLNSYIGELATLVPMVAGSAKRMDKTSILRLTATHLRIYYTLLNGATPKSEFHRVNQLALEQLMYEQLEGFLLILTPTGKIVFISHTVEQMLGHLQTDLMGQSIYTITSSEDHERLRVHLSPDILDSEWRRYFKLCLAKAGPRTESPTYEQFSVMGMIRPTAEGRGSKQSRDIVQSSSKVNNNVLVFFVKLYRPPPLSDMLIEANKEEYITRHLIDGRIVNCDHRISFVAGYMIEEVSGLSAFKFMHREDVRWTMIALRQMYDRGESVGWSCYRLLSRTGQFIYLRTFGYLEVDNSGVVESFVCVNTLVPEDEGEKLIKEMKERYSVMINASASPQQSNDSDVSNASVEDPIQLEACIKHLITNHLPISPKTDNCASPKPSAPFENQDCYLTESPADPHAIEYKHKVTSKVRRVASDDECAGGSMRKRMKRRTVSSSSSESLSSAYPQDPSTSSTTSSPGPGTTTLIMQSPPPPPPSPVQQQTSPHNGNTSTLCRPNVADRMVSSTNSNTVALGS